MSTDIGHPDRRQTIKRRPPFLALVSLLCLILACGAGCDMIKGILGGDDEGGDVKPTISRKVASAKAGAKKSGATAVKEEEITIEKLRAAREAREKEFTFSPENRPDPFSPIEALKKPLPDKGKKKKPVLPPLQRMELSQLKLVATVLAEPENSMALVEDSAGTGYIIKIGTKVGIRSGQVISIELNKVRVQERFKNYMGEEKTRISELKLRPIEGEK